jgi:hypothetical protein
MIVKTKSYFRDERKFKSSTKIYKHKNRILKESYLFIYWILKEIKKGNLETYYVDSIKQTSFPRWVRVQMIKLVRRRLKDLKQGKGEFEFRLLMPRFAYKDWIDEEYRARHIWFDSRKFFVNVVRKKRDDRSTSYMNEDSKFYYLKLEALQNRRVVKSGMVAAKSPGI